MVAEIFVKLAISFAALAVTLSRISLVAPGSPSSSLVLYCYSRQASKSFVRCGFTGRFDGAAFGAFKKQRGSCRVFLFLRA